MDTLNESVAQIKHANLIPKRTTPSIGQDRFTCMSLLENDCILLRYISVPHALDITALNSLKPALVISMEGCIQ